MEIHNQGNNLRPHLNQKPAGQPASGVAGGSAVDRSSESQPQRLIEGLRGNAEVRERLLVEISAKIAAGEYNTRAAAEEVAQRLVR